ncbi:hypothetical protein GA0115242_104889 [Streptomyces sp. SolWspMP-5a-2]|nr:hypothetical protein GA0115242_104889 [Streptomyces sp. SolWspMP-5a-2]
MINGLPNPPVLQRHASREPEFAGLDFSAFAGLRERMAREHTEVEAAARQARAGLDRYQNLAKGLGVEDGVARTVLRRVQAGHEPWEDQGTPSSAVIEEAANLLRALGSMTAFAEPQCAVEGLRLRNLSVRVTETIAGLSVQSSRRCVCPAFRERP